MWTDLTATGKRATGQPPIPRSGLVQVVFEPTNCCYGWLYEYGFESALVNPIRSRRFAEATGEHSNDTAVNAAAVASIGFIDSLEAIPPLR